LCSSVGRRRKRGTQNQAIGKSRGGLTTKIAVIVDALGNPIRFVLLPGQRHDITGFDALMMPAGCANDYAPTTWRPSFRSARGPADMPSMTGKKYKWRYLVENFPRIATRYEKTDKCFPAIINLVATVLRTR
jgi:transposase